MSEARTPAAPGPSEARGPSLLVRQLECLWQEGQRPDPDALLRGAGVSSPQELAEVLAADQWQRWQAGERVLAEDYLERHPAVAADPAAALLLVYGEFLVREELGEKPTPAEYLERFPLWGRALSQQFGFHAALDGAPTALGEPPPPQQARQPPPPAPPSPEMGAGPVVPGYELLEEIDRGGMGIVYKARQAGLNRVVALKMILPGRRLSPPDLARFAREARAAGSLDHPNIVPVHDFGDFNGTPFFTMPYVEGSSLQALAAGRPLDPVEAVRLLLPILDAVGHAHSRGIVHRDLKPANVLLDAAGRPRVTDFGLARLAQEEAALTQTGQLLGTPAYMAPEQAVAQGEVGPAADLYSLGAILYFLLTGQPPFSGSNPLTILRRVTDEPPQPPRERNPNVPEDLQAICLRCLAKAPAGRYPIVADLALALEGWLRRSSTRVFEMPSAPQEVALVEKSPPVLLVSADSPPTRSLRGNPSPLAGGERDEERGSFSALPRQPRRWPRLLAGMLILTVGLAGGGLAWWLTTPRPLTGPALPSRARKDFRLDVLLQGGEPGHDGLQRFATSRPITLLVQADREAHLAVWCLDPDGTFVELFPNKYEKDDLLRPGQVRIIPKPNQTGKWYRLRPDRNEPGQFSALRVVASTQPLRVEGGEDLGDFRVFRGPEGERVKDIFRSIRLEEVEEGPERASSSGTFPDGVLASEQILRFRVDR